MPLKIKTINMKCNCIIEHFHPLCKTIRFQLFEWWTQKHGYDVAITAGTLGVSRSTVLRWIRQRDVPLSTAVLLDQLQQGPIYRMGVFRGGGAIRHDWRRVFEQPRQLSML